jgi:hypothetical protein
LLNFCLELKEEKIVPHKDKWYTSVEITKQKVIFRMALGGEFRHFGDDSEDEPHKNWMNTDFMASFFRVSSQRTFEVLRCFRTKSN